MAPGILSEEQAFFSSENLAALGFQDRVSVELSRLPGPLEGSYAKIACIQMYEHVGLSNHRTYSRKARSLLQKGGLFSQSGDHSPSEEESPGFQPDRFGSPLDPQDIFSGTELDNIGHTIEVMETCGFEVRDVDSLPGLHRNERALEEIVPTISLV